MMNRLTIALVTATVVASCSVKFEDGKTTTRAITVSATCGNAIVEIGEACDDGNTASGDACSGDCLHRFIACGTGWVAEGAPCVLPPRCGDGHVDSGEDCDDGNTEGGDDCPATCLFPPEAACGNGVIDPGEACDDSNNANGDYCSSNCHFVTGRCGDFVIQANEACDDGNTSDGDYCASTCRAVTGRCGDGTVQSNEVCDDANRVNDDYCSADCRTATGRCGDGLRQDNEGCDDGNTDNGDLCPSNCSALDLSACAETWDADLCPTPTDRFLSYSAVQAEAPTTCMVRLDGTAICRGGNMAGSCGIGRASLSENGSTPVASSYPFRQISAEGFAVCAIAVDNSLWCWGSNVRKDLGLGDVPSPENCHVEVPGGSTYDTPCSSIPVRVGSRVDWKKVVSAGELVCALSLNGEIWCWGNHQPTYPSYNRGTFLPKPTRIAASISWADLQISDATLSAGVNAQSIYAIDNSGQLWRWPSHYPGQNYSTAKITDPPELVTGLSGQVVSVSVERESAVAATTTGTYSIVIGLTFATPPQLISGAPLFTSVACARARYDNNVSACGLTASHQVYCWGANGAGQLDDGTTTDRTTPVLSHGGATYAAFGDLGPFCVLKANGETYCLSAGHYVRMHEHQ